MRLSEVGRSVARGFLDLVFAPICLGCDEWIPAGRSERLVCRVCWSRMHDIPFPRCDRCWSPKPASPHPIPVRESCPTCDTLPPAVRSVRSAFVLDGSSRQLAHALKYGGWKAVAGPMADRMSNLSFPLEVTEEVELVAPVPLSAVRLRERGYNQAELLAASFAGRMGWRMLPELLERTRSTRTQTTLHPDERRANVAGAFRVPDRMGHEIHRQHVVLVDDVWTTGATAVSCAEELLAAGARAVSVVTFGRALPDLRL